VSTAERPLAISAASTIVPSRPTTVATTRARSGSIAIRLRWSRSLRVGAVGVQVLFAFLHAVPFNAGWKLTIGVRLAMRKT
jgi:hypothetical protein